MIEYRGSLFKTGGNIIGTKWIDVSKGDMDKPNIRCRLVGKEFKTHQMMPYMRAHRR